MKKTTRHEVLITRDELDKALRSIIPDLPKHYSVDLLDINAPNRMQISFEDSGAQPIPDPTGKPFKYEGGELPLVDITFEQMEQNQELLIEWTDGTENWRICCFDPMYGKDEWQAYSEVFKDTRVLTRKFVNRIRKHA